MPRLVGQVELLRAREDVEASVKEKRKRKRFDGLLSGETWGGSAGWSIHAYDTKRRWARTPNFALPTLTT